MTATAKIFTTGNSQTVRLPKAFRLQVSEVWIRKDEASGVITLRPKQDDERKKIWPNRSGSFGSSPSPKNSFPRVTTRIAPAPPSTTT